SRSGNMVTVSCDLLSAMDNGCANDEISLRIFTTNESTDGFHPAFMRPGRIDRVFYFDNPTVEHRERLINTWHHELRSMIDAGTLAKKTDGLSYAEVDSIKNILCRH